MFDKHGFIRARNGAWFTPLLNEEKHLSWDIFSLISFVLQKKGQGKYQKKGAVDIRSVE